MKTNLEPDVKSPPAIEKVNSWHYPEQQANNNKSDSVLLLQNCRKRRQFTLEPIKAGSSKKACMDKNIASSEIGIDECHRPDESISVTESLSDKEFSTKYYYYKSLVAALQSSINES